MEKFKWFALGLITAGVGFLIYKFYKKDSNVYMDGFVSGFVGGFSVTKSHNAPKEYGEIAKNIQQKQTQNYTKNNAEYKKNLAK